MSTIDVEELRANLMHYVARAEAGESFSVTENGIVTVLLTPPRSSDTELVEGDEPVGTGDNKLRNPERHSGEDR
jgi:antitoxin (DNA-binding transcriptional repressor) of toxin-antitoxin stability system